MMRRPSITFRLAALFAAAAATVLLGIGLVIVRTTEDHFAEMDLHELYGKLELMRHAVGKIHSRAELSGLPPFLDDALVGHEGLSVAVRGADGATIFASADSSFLQALFERAPASGPTDVAPEPLEWESDGHPYRGIITAVPVAIAGMAPARVALALEISFHRDFIVAFRRLLWAAIGGGIVVMALLGWWIARRGIRPVREIAAVVGRISAQQLHERIAIARVPIELVDLSASFNDLLARLEDSFHRLSDFSADIAHELRTPVNTLMVQAQVALARERGAEEYRDILHSCLEEYERLASMIADMLFLAKADNGLVVPNAEEVDIAAEAQGLTDFYEAYAEDAAIRLTCSGEGRVRGDRLMLQRAIANLLSNAVKYTPRSGDIELVVATTADGSVVLRVANTGAPLGPEQLEQVFDRFYRGDPSRSKEAADGAGLGLAITRSIVQAHGGTIRAASAQGRTTFEISLPATTPVTASPRP